MKLRIFTDGACSGNPGPGGYGVIVLEEHGVKEIGGNERDSTNNRMELKAVIEALRYIKKKKIAGKVEIHSDSAYVVNAINQEWIKKWQFNGWKTSKQEPVKNQDLWEEFLILKGKNPNIKFVKVKGHSGNTYNEMADKLAVSEMKKIF